MFEVIFAKRSGNIGADSASSKRSVEEIAELRDHLQGRGGVVLVPGGGDGGRGREMVEKGMPTQYADTLGRLATVKNGIELAASLSEAKVPHRLFIAKTMRYADEHGIGHVELATPESLRACLENGEAAVVTGGYGLNKQSTDAAGLQHANDFQKAFPDANVRVTKTTEFDGIFTSDPRQDDGARRYTRISADVMASSPATNKGLDEVCQALLRQPGAPLDMFVYGDGQHTLLEAVTQSDCGTFGTWVVRKSGLRVLA